MQLFVRKWVLGVGGVYVSLYLLQCKNTMFASALFGFALCLCVCGYWCGICFILPPGVQWSLAILKVRDDTMGEGSVITATTPSPSLHLSIFAFMYSPLSLLWLLVCGLY